MKIYYAIVGRRSFLFRCAMVSVLAVFLLAGCAGTMAETQKKGISSIADKDYVIPKKPVDKHAIGWAWSKQFGPVEDANADEIQIKKEKSFNNMQQDFAYNIGLGLGAKSIEGLGGEAGIQRGKADRSKMEGVEIIGPVSLADVPFEPNVPYITEALRLANFKLSNESSLKAGIGASANAGIGSATAMLEGGVHGRRGLEGEGLVVAYKLHRIDTKSYAKAESGNQRLELDKSVDFPKGNVIVKARLQAIEPGAKKSLPRNLLWSCPRAEAASRDMVAAWIVEIRSTDPKRKSLAIAFPAFPKVEDCQSYQGTIFSRIDPVTDKIVRQRINLTIVEAEVSDAMKPTAWDARVSLIDESFNVRLVNPSEMGN
jgi:hypothetical protein